MTMRPSTELIRGLLTGGETDRLRAELEPYHPAGIAEAVLPLSDEELVGVLRALPDAGASVIEHLPTERQEAVLERLGLEQTSAVLEEMASDEAADLLAGLPSHQATRLLDEMAPEDAADVRELLAYPPDTAGGLMVTEVVTVREDHTAVQAMEHLRRHAPDAETVYYIYVVDPARRLRGVVALRELILAPPDALVGQIMVRDVAAARVDDDREVVARLFDRYRLLALPVVDAGRRLLGVVTLDDVMQAVTEEASEDAYRLAGLVEEVERLDSARLRAAKRLPWLLVLLAIEIGTARVIAGFEHALAAMVMLAYFIPMLNDQAGNMGVQSAAIAVRAIATGDVDRRSYRQFVFREALVGLTAGVASGVAGVAIGVVWQGSVAFGLTLGTTLAVVMLIASILGATIPLALTGLRRDPAVAAGPFIASTMDVITVTVYFTAAVLLLGLRAGR